jgi:WD40 repeat protein
MPTLLICSLLVLADNPQIAEIDRLIGQLGNAKLAEREAGSRRLEEIGPLALEALRKAARSPDAEVRRRAGELVQIILRPRLLAVLQGHTEAVSGIAFSPDGKVLASADVDGTLRLWETATGKQRAVLRGTIAFAAVAFSPDGKLVAGAGFNERHTPPNTRAQARLWEVASARERMTVTRDKAYFFSLAFSPDGSTLATVGSGDLDAEKHGGELAYWDVTTGKLRSSHILPEVFMLGCVVIPAGGKALAAGRGDGVLEVWDATSGKLKTFRGCQTDDLLSRHALTSDGRLLASAVAGKEAKVWEVSTGREQGTFGGHVEEVRALALTANGRTLATADAEGMIRLWDVARRKERGRVPGHGESVLCLVFSADGNMLASSGSDRSVRLWDISRLSGTEPVK